MASPTRRLPCDREALRNRVREYVARHPGCTTADVATDVLRGSAEAHSRARTLATRLLLELVRAQVVRRDRGGPASWQRMPEYHYRLEAEG